MPSPQNKHPAISPWKSIGDAADQVIKNLAASPTAAPDLTASTDDKPATEIMATVAHAATMHERNRCIGIIRTSGYEANQTALAESIIVRIGEHDHQDPLRESGADRRAAKIARIMAAKQEARAREGA